MNKSDSLTRVTCALAATQLFASSVYAQPPIPPIEPPAEAAPAPPVEGSAEAGPPTGDFAPLDATEPAPTQPYAPATTEPLAPEPLAEAEPQVAAPVPEIATEEAPPAEEFTVTTGIGYRAALRFQDPQDPESLGDVGFDELNVEPRFSGRVTDVVGWTANLTVSGRTIDTGAGGPLAFEARALDLVGQLDFADEFHVWMGRMLTPGDRSNFSGAWFMSPWNYSGVFFAGPYVGPRGTEEFGRETGVVAWGNTKDGKFKYYAGVMDLDGNAANGIFGGDTNAANPNPLYAARVNVALIGSEPGFYGSSTYYGSQDILALGVAGRVQQNYLSPENDIGEFNMDLLAEFNAPAGTFTGELAYYYYNGLQPMDNHFFGVLSYTTAEPVGIGKIQPLIRYQYANNVDDSETVASLTQFEAGVNYVIKDYFAKIALNYVYSSASALGTEDYSVNLLQLGLQIQQ